MAKKKELTDEEKINREIHELEDQTWRFLVKGVDSTEGFEKNLKKIFDPKDGILNKRNTVLYGMHHWADSIEALLAYFEEAASAWSEYDRSRVFDAMFGAGVIWGQFIERRNIDRGYTPFHTGRKGGNKRAIPLLDRKARAEELFKQYKDTFGITGRRSPSQRCEIVATQYSKKNGKKLGGKLGGRRVYDELIEFGYLSPKKK